MKWLAAALALKAVTHLPVLLPQQVPNNPPFAIVEERRADFYSVDFAWTRDCNGAHACSEAHVIGSLRPMPLGYVPSSVGAYCNDASLAWRAERAYYQVMLKCGTPAQLHAMRASMRRYFR